MTLRDARRRQGLTQARVAAELRVSRSTVAMWENGYCYPKVRRLADLARVLGVEVPEILPSAPTQKSVQ